jgi:hypothetical protein
MVAATNAIGRPQEDVAGRTTFVAQLRQQFTHNCSVQKRHLAKRWTPRMDGAWTMLMTGSNTTWMR